MNFNNIVQSYVELIKRIQANDDLNLGEEEEYFEGHEYQIIDYLSLSIMVNLHEYYGIDAAIAVSIKAMVESHLLRILEIE